MGGIIFIAHTETADNVSLQSSILVTLFCLKSHFLCENKESVMDVFDNGFMDFIWNGLITWQGLAKLIMTAASPSRNFN